MITVAGQTEALARRQLVQELAAMPVLDARPVREIVDDLNGL
jgi:hypothetical protein